MDIFSGSGFGGVDFTSDDLSSADALVLPVPFDGAVSYLSGTREGPSAIIRASEQVELYDAQWGVDCADLSIALLDEVEPDVSGPANMVEKVKTVYKAAMEKCGFILMLGGDHSLTCAPAQVLAERYGPSLTVVQFDAHTDLRENYQGSPFSHACVMRRVVDHASIVQVGVRNISLEEEQFIGQSGHPVYKAWDMHSDPGWIDSLVDNISEHVYITFDLDGLDPSVVPGVGTPEPGGLSWEMAVSAIKAIGERSQVVGADVMELRPIPGSVQSEFTAARLCYKLLAAALLLNR